MSRYIAHPPRNKSLLFSCISGSTAPPSFSSRHLELKTRISLGTPWSIGRDGTQNFRFEPPPPKIVPTRSNRKEVIAGP